MGEERNPLPAAASPDSALRSNGGSLGQGGVLVGITVALHSQDLGSDGAYAT